MFLGEIQMVLLSLALHKHVVNVDLDVSFNLMGKHLIHETLIRRANILKAEQHYFVEKKVLADDE